MPAENQPLLMLASVWDYVMGNDTGLSFGEMHRGTGMPPGLFYCPAGKYPKDQSPTATPDTLPAAWKLALPLRHACTQASTRQFLWLVKHQDASFSSSSSSTYFYLPLHLTSPNYPGVVLKQQAPFNPPGRLTQSFKIRNLPAFPDGFLTPAADLPSAASPGRGAVCRASRDGFMGPDWEGKRKGIRGFGQGSLQLGTIAFDTVGPI